MAGYFVFAAFALVAEGVLASVMIFAPAARSGRGRMLIKCVCSGWFILTGIASAAFSGGVSAYALFVLLGLTASFWGDFFLQLEDQEKYFVVGVFCFMAAHLLYITAFSLAAEKLFPERPFLSFWQAAAVAVVMAGLLIMILTARLKLGKMFVPGMMYIAAISLMFVKAVSLGLFAFFSLPALTGTAALVTLCSGALLFVISDTVLVFIVFGGKSSLRMTAVNLYTYFIAQTLLALSVYMLA